MLTLEVAKSLPKADQSFFNEPRVSTDFAMSAIAASPNSLKSALVILTESEVVLPANEVTACSMSSASFAPSVGLPFTHLSPWLFFT